MKKIVYVSDYVLDCYNSVRDILFNLINIKDLENYEQVIVKSQGSMSKPIKIEYYDGFKSYRNTNISTKEYLRSKPLTFGIKLRHVFYKILRRIAGVLRLERIVKRFDNMSYIGTLFKKESPDLVVFLASNPPKNHAKKCVKRSIPYVTVLYDTYIGRPGVDIARAYSLENGVIKNSQAYFVPDFFYELYLKTYNNDKLRSFRLPLLIEKKDVLAAYQKATTRFDFVYFGQIQYFRSGEKVKEIFRSLNATLNIFSTEKYVSDETFKSYPAVTKNELYEIVAGSKFLVVMDNGAPYQDFLPSKAYLYSSFTKPIIAFGDNEHSALKSFFKDYPWFYYHYIGESTEPLKRFLNRKLENTFDEKCYSRYIQYLPETALVPLVETIKKTTNSANEKTKEKDWA